MRLPHTPGFAKRNLQLLKYRAGITKSVQTFRDGPPERITIVVPNSLGDVAINSGVTRSLRQRWPAAAITLVTDRRYEAAAALNPDYDAVALLDAHTNKPPWALSHAEQVAAARALTPAMDMLLLCQAGAWCDALWARYQSMELQHELARTPPGQHHHPQLVLPLGAIEAVRPIRERAGGRAVFIAPGAYTLKLGAHGEGWFADVAVRFAASGWHVFWNGAEPPARIGDTGTIVPVGPLVLAEVVALAALCDRAVSARSGLCDVITFCAPELPHYVLYPKTRYPYSFRPVLECYSLTRMGGRHVDERENSLESEADAARELRSVESWIGSDLVSGGRPTADP